MIVIGWLAAFLIFLGIEAATVSLTSIWFAGGALAGLGACALGLDIRIQLGVFVAVSFLLLLLIRPLAQGYLKRKETRTNVDGLAGRTAVVRERVDCLSGSADLDGQIWLARAAESGEAFEPGCPVEIVRVDGAKLMVRRRAVKN